MPHCNAPATGLKSCANKREEESMKCPYCHEEVDSVVVIQRVELLADLDGDTIGEYYQDDDPITEIEDIRCRSCDGSLFELIKE